MKSLILGFFIVSNLFAATVDLKKSTFKWEGTKVTGKHFGKLSLKSAKLEQEKTGTIKSGEFIIDLDTLTVDDISGDIGKKFITHIKSADFLDTKKFPVAKLVISKDDGKQLTGDLTIRGKTNKVTIPYKKNKNQYDGVLKFDRTKFDMKYGSGSFFKGLGDKMINDEVSLTFKVVTK